MKHTLRKYLVFIFLAQIIRPEISIRHALHDDLDAIMALDREISWEYFKPLFLEYTGLPLAEHADEILENDLLYDQEMFLQGINQKDNNKLLVAVDKNTLIGFVAFSKQSKTISIDLLFVSKDFRNKKVGKRLLDSAVATFGDSEYCTLLVLDKNISARKLYESYGFSETTVPQEIKEHLPQNYSYIYIFYLLNLQKKKSVGENYEKIIYRPYFVRYLHH